MPLPPTHLSLRTLTLGCRVNQYETEYVRQGLLQAGYRDAQEEEPAQLCVVNTCTVTHEGDVKSRHLIRQLAKRNPQARIIVMGCYATRAPEEVAALPGVVEVLTDKRELPDLLGRFGLVDIPSGISEFQGRRRAYVKVQDGCLLNCTFCIIPQVRPHLRSRPLADIEAEVGRLVAHGHREIVLTGIHLGHYGIEWNRGRPKREWQRLSHLVDRLARLEGDFRIRLSSLEATELTRELIDAMAEHRDRVCPHLHLSMQSGSDEILRKMRRRWGSQRFLDRVARLRQTLHLPSVTTDVIVGFPGETETHFEETLAACQAAGFSKIHIFPFSARKGTPAATMPHQVPDEVKAERCRRLAELEIKLRDDYLQSLIGQPLQVMLEQTHESDIMSGTSCRFMPVKIQGLRAPLGSLVRVHPHGMEEGQLLAVAESDSCGAVHATSCLNYCDEAEPQAAIG